MPEYIAVIRRVETSQANIRLEADDSLGASNYMETLMADIDQLENEFDYHEVSVEHRFITLVKVEVDHA